MYCSECGVEATGKFCWSCGAPLRAGASPAAAPPAPAVAWDPNEPSYAAVVALPGVRELLAAEADAADNPMTAEEFLATCQKVLPQPVPLVPLYEIVGPLYGRLGIKTGRTEKRSVALPAGVALAGVLASLARHGNDIRRVEQATDGCVVHAELSSSMWHGKGDIVVTVEQEGAGSSVEAATKIPGQVFDWGRSKVRLEALFEDLLDDRVRAATGA